MIKKLFAVVAFIGATTASLTAQTFAYPDWWNKNNRFEEVEAYTESNMTMTVMGTIDGVRCDDAFEIGVFCSNGDCREVQPFFRYINQTFFERFYFYSKLTINGSTGESFSFRLYDHRHNVEVLAETAPANINYVADANYGSLGNFYDLAFVNSTTHRNALEVNDSTDLPFTGEQYPITTEGIACSYTRSAYLDGGYETIVLPFDADIASIKEAGFVFEKFDKFGDNTIKFVELDEGEILKAGVPYLFSYAGDPSDGRKEIKFVGTMPTMNDNIVGSEGWTGTFKKMTGNAIAGKYILNIKGDKMQKASAKASLAPYHCYLELPADVNVATLAVSHRTSDATIITNVVVHDDAEVIYDLCGRKLDKMPESGVVIKNNKKIYIK